MTKTRCKQKKMKKVISPAYKCKKCNELVEKKKQVCRPEKL